MGAEIALLLVSAAITWIVGQSKAEWAGGRRWKTAKRLRRIASGGGWYE